MAGSLRFRVTASALCGLAFAFASASAVAATGAPPDANAPDAPPSASPSAPLVFRIFLTDGSTLSSLGEFARVGDRVVFSLPLGETQQTLATVPASTVDWPKTNEYAYAVRSVRYAQSRGELDYAAMTTHVARMLSEIALTKGAAAQLAIAERARGILADWPRQHFGYREDDVRQTLVLLDEIIAGLRVASGHTSFDLALVSRPSARPAAALMRPPTLQESIEQALQLSALSATGSERTALLRDASRALERSSNVLSPDWAAAARARLRAATEIERRTDRAYATLVSSTMRDIDRKTAAADVQGILALRGRASERDGALGRKRPDEMRALMSSIDIRLDSARRLRLARDRWAARLPLVRAYRADVEPWTKLLTRARKMLADIRTLAGPSAEQLGQFLVRLERLAPRLPSVRVPEELRVPHASLVSALQMAETAARYRHRALLDNDLALAWNASSAAAGALMLFERSEKDAARLSAPPDISQSPRLVR